MFSELTKNRIRRFKKVKRAYYSLLILFGAFFLSLFSEFISNNKPYIMSYEGQVYFPLFKFYSAQTFGGEYRTEADYIALKKNPEFMSHVGFMIFPPIPHDPLYAYLDNEGEPPHKPTLKHWLGTDSIARDVFARLLYGFRTCMLFSLALSLFVALLGIVIGGVQGYFGGWVDITVQRLIEIWSTIPFLYVVILFGSIYGRGFFLLLVIMGLFSWIGLSYYMRGEFLRLRNLNYIKISKALGLSHFRIFTRHIFPNAISPVVTILPFVLIGGIGGLTSLDFLGFGLQPPDPSWGELLSQGLYNLYAPWIALSTVTALFVTLLLATFIGEGVREAFDPKRDIYLE